MAVHYGNDGDNYATHTSAAGCRGAMPSYYYSNIAPATDLQPAADALELRGYHHHCSPAPSVSKHRRRRSPSPPPRDPIHRAHHAIKQTFTNSTSGMSVGVLGAVIGGLVAREASEAVTTPRRKPSKGHHGGHGHSHPHQETNPDRKRLISTLVGAAVGGLGANALEKKIEVARKRTAGKEAAWERTWKKESHGQRRNGPNDNGLDKDPVRWRNERRYRD